MTSSSPVVHFVQNSSDNFASSTLQSTSKSIEMNNISEDYTIMDSCHCSPEDFSAKFENLIEDNSNENVAVPKYIFISAKSSDDPIISGTGAQLNDQATVSKFLLLPTNVNQVTDLSKSVLLLTNSDMKNIFPSPHPPNKLPLPKLLPNDLLYECKECTKTFPRKKDLKEHESAVHIKKEKAKKVGNYVCTLCSKVFTTKKGESSHRITIHGVRKNKKYIKCREVDCDSVFGRIAELRSHLRIKHKLYEMENTKELKFKTKEEFIQWLAAEEIASKTHFISLVSERECHGYTFSELGCNRGGIYHPQGPCEGKIPRNIKAQGTSKIGFQCTARVRVKDFKSHVEVTYFPEHYKHEKSLSHLPLPKLEKEVIKEKLLQGVDEKKILQDLKLSMTDVERKHLVTRKHLDNYKRQLGIKRTSEQLVIENDEQSVFAWVEEMQQKDYNPVLLYKRQAEEFEGLDYNDFMLILMTAFQKTMLAEFNYTTVCIHCMDRISDYDFELLTLILANKHEEGVPVAFCIVSTICEKTVTMFLNCIRKVQYLKPAIFISSDLPIFYNAWEQMFNACEQCFLSSWYVMGQWQSQLSLIKKKPKKDEVQRILKALMYERNDETFNELLENFRHFNDDEDTKEFYDFFMNYYYVRSYMWAYCFRKEAKVQSDMHINVFHKNLKQLLLGKKPRRIDKCIVKLVNLVSDKKFFDFIKSQKQTDNQTYETLEIPFFNEGDNVEWEILSESGGSYRISKDLSLNKDGATIPHSASNNYKCTCDDYVGLNMPCKHIDFVFQFAEANPIIKINDEESSIETEITSVSTVEEPAYSLTFIKKQLASVSSKLNSVQVLNDNVIQQINEHFKQIDFTKNSANPSVPETPNIPTSYLSCNKNNVIRKQFFSVKKDSPNKKARLSDEGALELASAEAILEQMISMPGGKKYDNS